MTRVGQAGGNAAGCGLPNGPSALALNITAVQPGSLGNIVAYQAGAVAPLSSALNFLAGQTIANTTIVPIQPGSGDSFALLNNSVGATDLVGDVVGYFWEYAGTSCARTSANAGVASGASGDIVASCAAGPRGVGGGCSASAGGIAWLDRGPIAGGSGYHCSVKNGLGSYVYVTTTVMCCPAGGR